MNALDTTIYCGVTLEQGGPMATKIKNFPVKLPPALGLCDECLTDRKNTATNGVLIVSYCVHNRVGGYMFMEGGRPSRRWYLYGPVSPEVWARIIDEATALSEGNAAGSHSGLNKTAALN